MRTTWLLLLAGGLALPGMEISAQSGKTSPGSARVGQLFVTSHQCMACHNGLVSPDGNDVSIGTSWKGSMMANSARDPYWQGAVRRETLDHPSAAAEIENECAACHMPMSRAQAKANGQLEGVFSHLPLLQVGGTVDQLAADGVSCTVCHQIQDKGLGSRDSFNAGFSVDYALPMGSRKVFGPYAVDEGRRRIMQSGAKFSPEQSIHIQKSEVCATCHTLFTHSLGPSGETTGELPEQVPYLEWLNSSYSQNMSCQSCHMPVIESEMPISSAWGVPRSGFSQHAFRGGNFFIPRVFSRYQKELGVVASSQELTATADRTTRHLETDSARISIEELKASAGTLQVQLFIESLAGHKLPTAYPSRRAWVHLEIRDGKGTPVFESGAFRSDGSVEGNDNDRDATLFEPHYDVISSPDEVQIYEAVMADPKGLVTTGLLKAVRFIKDNRLLPKGFDKSSADDAVAVRGRAGDDGNFTNGGDRLRYSIELGKAKGPFTVVAELWYQPIAFRWAQNLRDKESFETQRFVSYYDSMAESSALVLARGTASTE